MIEVGFRHRFADIELDIAFAAPSPGLTVLFGPSGAGKTSVVAALSGLLRPESGRIAVDGVVLSDAASGTFVRPERRRLGLVFQEARLFPHLSVAGNLRFGLRRAPAGPFRLDQVAALLGIGHLLRRRPHTLSGGERQRVAIGRALLSQPRLLLMDEPLASLDAARRGDIMAFLSTLKREVGLPIVYVTHAADELAALADSVVLLQQGRVLASGPLADLSARADLPLALREDAGAVLAARVLRHDTVRMLCDVQVEAGPLLRVPPQPHPVGSPVRLKVFARDVVLAAATPPEISVQNVLDGTVDAVQATEAGAVLARIALGGARILARLTADAALRLGIGPGRPVVALLKSTAIAVLPG